MAHKLAGGRRGIRTSRASRLSWMSLGRGDELPLPNYRAALEAAESL
jgi:hypothetical protein